MLRVNRAGLDVKRIIFYNILSIPTDTFNNVNVCPSYVI